MGNTSNMEQWAARERMAFVERAAFWRGVVNRGDLSEIFGVSSAQASADLTRYQEANPGALVYQMRKKRYEGTEGMRCILHVPRFEDALVLFLTKGGGPSSLPGFLGSTASQPQSGDRVAVVELPMRDGRLAVQRMVFRAVLHGLRVSVVYGSVKSKKIAQRWLRPHAFGHDGYRWHARAWCETKCNFQDFALSRIQEAEWPVEPGPLPTPDAAWDKWEILKIKPSEELTEEGRKIMEADYDMTNGRKNLKVRAAMMNYTRDHLRLPRTDGSVMPRHLDLAE